MLKQSQLPQLLLGEQRTAQQETRALGNLFWIAVWNSTQQRAEVKGALSKEVGEYGRLEKNWEVLQNGKDSLEKLFTKSLWLPPKKHLSQTISANCSWLGWCLGVRETNGVFLYYYRKHPSMFHVHILWIHRSFTALTVLPQILAPFLIKHHLHSPHKHMCHEIET